MIRISIEWNDAFDEDAGEGESTFTKHYRNDSVGENLPWMFYDIMKVIRPPRPGLIMAKFAGTLLEDLLQTKTTVTRWEEIEGEIFDAAVKLEEFWDEHDAEMKKPAP